jgi:hypothetical protein
VPSHARRPLGKGGLRFPPLAWGDVAPSRRGCARGALAAAGGQPLTAIGFMLCAVDVREGLP